MRRWQRRLRPSNRLPCRATSSRKYCCASSISYCGQTLDTSVKPSKGRHPPSTPKRKCRMRLEKQLDFWKRRHMRWARWTVGSFLELVLLIAMLIFSVVTRCFWKLWNTDLPGRENLEFSWFEPDSEDPETMFYHETEDPSKLLQLLPSLQPLFYPSYRNWPTDSTSWGLLATNKSLPVGREAVFTSSRASVLVQPIISVKVSCQRANKFNYNTASRMFDLRGQFHYRKRISEYWMDFQALVS